MKNSTGYDPEHPARLYVDGVFDMTHFGHFRLFEHCKKRFPYVHLIVGVNGDEDCARLKNKCVLTEQERAENIRHCRWVDEVVCPGPWFLTNEFLAENQIDFVCHDDAPYSYGDDDLYAHIRKQGKFMATPRTEGISTSMIMTRVFTHSGLYTRKLLGEIQPEDELKKQLLHTSDEIGSLWKEVDL